jgi:hypothetical protein
LNKLSFYRNSKMKFLCFHSGMWENIIACHLSKFCITREQHDKEFFYYSYHCKNGMMSQIITRQIQTWSSCYYEFIKRKYTNKFTNNKEEWGGEINLHQMIPITKKGGVIWLICSLEWFICLLCLLIYKVDVIFWSEWLRKY